MASGYQKLSASQAKIAKNFIHDLLVAAGQIKPCKVYIDDRGNSYSAPAKNYFDAAAATGIVNELINRSCSNINPEIDKIFYQGFYMFKPASGRYRARWSYTTVKTKQILASYLVHYALSEGLYWDDTIKSVYELELFEKTYLGAAVKEMGAYLSNQAPVKTKKTTTKAAGTGSSKGGAPQNDYKSSGPQSGNVRDLKSSGKVLASATGNWIFKIEGTNAKSAKVTPTAHIKPLKAAGAAGNTNKVFFGSANGYTDCTCYFDDIKNADAFLQKVSANLPANISNPHVVKTKADANGYFIVGTEYGDCAIAARKLNENFTESTEQTEESYKPHDLDTYIYDCLKHD